MRRKKPLDRGGGGGGAELFICFTSRPSASSSSAAPTTLRPSSSSKLLSPGRATATSGDALPPPLSASLSRRLRNSGSIKGGQSPMFPTAAAAGGRRKGGFEAAEPSSPKVTCIGQVRVKGGKRKPKGKPPQSAAALRSRSKRSNAEPSFRRIDQGDGECLPSKNQGWVYQIPVNICEALKTFGSEINCFLPCGGRSFCSASRDAGDGEKGVASGDKKRRRATGSWLCGATVARWLMAIQEEEEEQGGKDGGIVVEEMKRADVGLVMEGWEMGEKEVVGEVDLEKNDEILVVGKEEEGRVSVCIPPRNALLLMRCRSDPVRMAALATRFWGSPAATAGQVEDEEGDEEEEEEGEVEKECEERSHDLAASLKETECQDLFGEKESACEAVEVDQENLEAEECVKHGDLNEEEKSGEQLEKEKVKGEIEEAQIFRKDVTFDTELEAEAQEEEAELSDQVVAVMEVRDEEEKAPSAEKEEEVVKVRRTSSSCYPSMAVKEDRKLCRLGSRRRGSSSSGVSSGRNRGGRRHSFSAEIDARRPSFSSLKEARRASFSIDRDGRRWSFSIEQEHLVAEPKVLMGPKKGRKISPEPEYDKDHSVLVAANNVDEAQEAQEIGDHGKEKAMENSEEQEESTHGVETKEKVQKEESGEEQAEEADEKEEQKKKKSGELPDCLLLMMYEPKLSMEVSKETWVCSTDFVHWRSYQGNDHRNCIQQKAIAGSGTAAEEAKANGGNAGGTNAQKFAEELNVPPTSNLAPKPPQVIPHPATAATEQKLRLERPLVTTAAAYAPFVLKRCKSEPMRSSARLAPDACFWKDRHRPIGATGIGF